MSENTIAEVEHWAEHPGGVTRCPAVRCTLNGFLALSRAVRGYDSRQAAVRFFFQVQNGPDSLIENMLVYITVFVCAYAFALLVYRYDMYEKEPWYMLLLVVALGMAAALGIGFVEDIAIESFNQQESVGGQAAIAAFFEETVKLLIVVLVAVVFSQEFNDPIDGLVYGAFAGLGFALYESLFYLSFAPPVPQQTGTEAVRLLLHLLMGGLAGFGLGLARFPKRMPLWPLVLPCGVGAAMGIHFLWDYWCGIPRDDVSEAFQRIAAVGLLLTATALFGVAVMMGVRRSRAMFSPRDKKRIWGWPFSLLFRRAD